MKLKISKSFAYTLSAILMTQGAEYRRHRDDKQYSKKIRKKDARTARRCFRLTKQIERKL